MKRSGFLPKAVFLLAALCGVLVLIVSIRATIAGTTLEAGQGQSFFEQFVVAGGPVVWFVLLPMSLVTVYLAADYSLTIRRNKLLPVRTGQSIIRTLHHNGLEELHRQTAQRSDFVSVAVGRAVVQCRGDWLRMRSIVAESLQEQAGALFRRIEWINLIGNVSPMVGLFGTVFGMIKLFNAIVVAGGQPHPAQLAEGISVALVTTFWGLFIAIPALTVYGVFANRIETLAGDAVTEAENVVSEMRRVLRRQQQKDKAEIKVPIVGYKEKTSPANEQQQTFQKKY